MDPDDLTERTDEAKPDDEAGEEPRWDPASQVIGDTEYAETYYSRWHELIDEEVEFVLDQVQYKDEGSRKLDDEELDPKDLSLLSTARRKWSQIGAAPLHLRTWPVDMMGDPLSAERTRWAIEREVYSSKNLFMRKRKRAIMGSVVGRLWYLGLEWDADLQEIVYRTHAPKDVLKCPGFIDLNDPQIPWAILKGRSPVESVKALARALGEMSEDEVRDIKADSQGDTQASKSGEPPGVTTLNLSNPEGGPAIGQQDTVEYLIGMYRVDPERHFIEETLGEPEPLPESEWYMRCWTCGLEVRDHPVDANTGKLPATGEPCPQCQAQAQAEGMPGADLEGPLLERVDSVEEVDRYPEFPNGRWVVVLRESRAVVYSKGWPYVKPNGDTLRHFPLVEYRIYDDMRHEIPHSDVSWQWNQQAITTYMLQWAVEQMRTSGRVIIMPRNGFVDSRGRTKMLTNRLDQVMFLRDPMLANAIKEFQPRGLAQGWMELFQTLQNSFKSNLGTGELGLGPEQSKDIPVGTVRAITESGDIPIDDAIAMVRETDTLLLGLIGDMAQCCWNQRRWIRYLGVDGAIGYEYFGGADLTGVDVEISGTPHMDQQRGSELERWMQFFQMTPPQQRLVGRLMNLNPTELYQFQNDQMQFMMTGGLMPGPGPGGAPSGEPGAGGSGVPAPPGLAPAGPAGNPQRPTGARREAVPAS